MKFDPVRVVEQPVAEGIGDGGVSHLVVPLAHGKLTREDRGPISIAIFHDFEQVETIAVAQWGKPPVVEDQHVDPSQLGHNQRG